jgi:tryptophan synthase alpha chain
MSRIADQFAKLKSQNRAGLISFITAGDPDRINSQALLDGLPDAGADFIEFGMPFSDPMADGPAIQAASLRAIKAGITIDIVLDMVKSFRVKNNHTPLILMGYYNPIYAKGIQSFCKEAAQAGVDGLIIVDLPPEEAAELSVPAKQENIDFIFMATPTTDSDRLPEVLSHASGFIYYVSIAGITGTSSAQKSDVKVALNQLRRSTSLPIAVGFGLKTPEQVHEISQIADAAVVGSAIIQLISDNLDSNGKANNQLIDKVLNFVTQLASKVTRHSLRD